MGCESRHWHSSNDSERYKAVCGTVSISLPGENIPVREHTGPTVFRRGGYHSQQNEHRGIFRDRRSSCQGIPPGCGRTIFRKVLRRDRGYLLILKVRSSKRMFRMPCRHGAYPVPDLLRTLRRSFPHRTNTDPKFGQPSTTVSDRSRYRDGISIPFGSNGRGFESLRARQNFQGVAAHAVAPFSFDCEVFVKFVGGMTSGIMHGESSRVPSTDHRGGDRDGTHRLLLEGHVFHAVTMNPCCIPWHLDIKTLIDSSRTRSLVFRSWPPTPEGAECDQMRSSTSSTLSLHTLITR